MRIVVDARSLSGRPTGIGQYLMAAVNVWSELQPDVDFILLSNKPIHADSEPFLTKSSNVSYQCCPAPIMGGNGLLWILFWFSKVASDVSATHIWGAGGILPVMCGRKFVKIITVHDLVFKSLGWTMSKKTRLVYGLLAGWSIKFADVIWAVSNFTSKEIDFYYPKANPSVRVIGSGLNPLRIIKKFDPDFLIFIIDKYKVGPRTLLFVGTLEPRKNLAFLLSLMPDLALSGFNLLVVGGAGWGKTDLAFLVNDPAFPRDAVHFCNFVPDEELQALYQSVGFYISTALMEGFGLPQLEAMSAGCPVISASNSAVVEVVGSGGILVEGWDKKDWCRSVQYAFSKRDVLKKNALENASKHLMGNACRSMVVELARLK